MEFEVLSPRHLPFFLFVSLQMRLFSSTKKANVTAQGAEEDDAEEICVKPLNALYLVDFCGLHVASAWHLPHRRRAKPDHLLISTVLQNVDTWSKQQQQSALYALQCYTTPATTAGNECLLCSWDAGCRVRLYFFYWRRLKNVSLAFASSSVHWRLKMKPATPSFLNQKVMGSLGKKQTVRKNSVCESM